MAVYAVELVIGELTTYWRCGQENPSKPVRRGPSEAGECVKQEGAGKANRVLECPEEALCLVLGPSSLPRVVPTLLVPTLAARVAGVPQNREGSRSVTMSAGGRCCEFLRSCRSEGCLSAKVLSAARLYGRDSGPCQHFLWGEWSHLSRKPLQGHAVTSPDRWGRPRLGQEGHHTAGRPLGDMAPPPPSPPGRYTASPPPSNPAKAATRGQALVFPGTQ